MRSSSMRLTKADMLRSALAASMRSQSATSSRSVNVKFFMARSRLQGLGDYTKIVLHVSCVKRVPVRACVLGWPAGASDAARLHSNIPVPGLLEGARCSVGFVVQPCQQQGAKTEQVRKLIALNKKRVAKIDVVNAEQHRHRVANKCGPKVTGGHGRAAIRRRIVRIPPSQKNARRAPT